MKTLLYTLIILCSIACNSPAEQYRTLTLYDVHGKEVGSWTGKIAQDVEPTDKEVYYACGSNGQVNLSKPHEEVVPATGEFAW